MKVKKRKNEFVEPSSSSSLWRSDDLTFDSRSFFFNLSELTFMIIYEDFFKKWSFSLVFKTLFVLPKSHLPITLFLSSFILVYKSFHPFEKFLLLISSYESTHFISFVLVKQNWFEILSVLRLTLLTELLFALLNLLVKINEIRQLINFLIIDVFIPNIMILLFKMIDLILISLDQWWSLCSLVILLHQWKRLYFVINGYSIFG